MNMGLYPNTVSHLLQQTAHFSFLLSYRYSTRDTILATAPIRPIAVITKEVICIASLRDISRESYTHASIPLIAG